jgi:hypothetical protein
MAWIETEQIEGACIVTDRSSRRFRTPVGTSLVVIDHKEEVAGGFEELYGVVVCKSTSDARVLEKLAYVKAHPSTTPRVADLADKAMRHCVHIRGEETRVIRNIKQSELQSIHEAEADWSTVPKLTQTEREAFDSLLGKSTRRRIQEPGCLPGSEYFDNIYRCTVVAPKGRDVLLVVENTDAAVNDDIMGIVSWPIALAKSRVQEEDVPDVRSAPRDNLPYPDEKENLVDFPFCLEVAKKLKWSKDIAEKDDDVYIHEIMACSKAAIDSEWTRHGASPSKVKELLQDLEEVLEKVPLLLLTEVLSAEEAGAEIREAYRRVNAAAKAAPRPPDSTKHPYCVELHRIVKDEYEWQQFITLFFAMYLPYPASMTRMATQAKMRMVAYNLMEKKMEKVLEPQGGVNVLTSITFDGTATQTGPDVIAELDCFMGNMALDDGAEEVRGTPSMKVNVQAVRSIDTSGTETEQVERAKMLAAVTSLKDAERKSIDKLAKLAEDSKGAEIEAEIAKGNVSSEVIRLVKSGKEFDKAVADHIEPELYRQLRATRSCLARRVDAQFVEDGQQPSDGVMENNRKVRVGNMKDIRLLKYIDRTDGGSTENPLTGFATYNDQQADTLFSSAIRKVQRAWVFCQAEDTADIMHFCDKLTDKVLEMRSLGMSWVDLGKWYAALFAKVDEVADKHARAQSVGRLRGKPDAKWITDSTTRYAKELEARRHEVISERAAERHAKKIETRCTELMAEAKAAKAEAKETKAAAKRFHDIDPNKEGLTGKERKAQEAERKRKVAEAKEEAAARKAAKAEKAATDKAPLVGSWDGRSQKSQRQHLLETLGTHDKNGKSVPPCVFFHTEGKSCKHSDDDCPFWHK